MKSGGPWNLRGLRPQALAAARAAARRSGVSVGEWLNDLIEQTDNYGGDAVPPDDDDYAWPEPGGRDDYRRRGAARPPRRDHDDEDDRAARDSVLALEELSEVHARLDRLTDQLYQMVRGTAPLRGAPMQPQHRRSGLTGDRRSQEGHGDNTAPAAVSSAANPPDPPSPATAPQMSAEAAETAAPGQPVEFPELEDQLRRITAQLESLRSTGLDKVIAVFRSDLADIRRQLTEALPRQAVESLCVEVEALARRIDRSRERTGNPDAIAGIERGLAEIRDALRRMTTAEHLVGFDEALKALAQKLDLIIGREDPAALRQLETAIGALRGIVSHVASNDALGKVAEDVRSLAAKIDSLAKGAASGQAVSALGGRIDTLTDAINASAEVAAPRGLDKTLSDIMEKLEAVRLTTDPTAFKRLEERIAQLIGRLDASDARLGNMAAVERGFADLLAHIEPLRGTDDPAAASASSRPAVAAIARDVAEIKRSEQRTQESLEAVHGTVEQVVGRLAMIESDIHDVAMLAPRSQMSAQLAADKAQPKAAGPAAAGGPTAPAELIASAERQDFIAAARRATQAATAPASDAAMRSRSRLRWRSRRASGEMAENRSSHRRNLLVAAAIVLFSVGCLQIAFHVFGDSRPTGETVAPWQRPADPAPQPDSNPPAAVPRSGSLQPAGKAEPASATSPPVALVPPVASVPPDGASAQNSPAESTAPPPAPQSLAATDPQPSAAPAAPPASPQPSPSPSPSSADPTGSLPARPMPPVAAPPASPPVSNSAAMNAPDVAPDTLPPAIGGPALRAAAITGDASAQYEIGLRFGEGRGVPRNERQAASWLELAAKQGLAPAQFRLGGYYEKGIGVKKDLAAARDLYLAAAAKGNGKAMHNLAVLYADGVNGRNDYHTAALWFRKAADRGITDSQYNLAILYARGSGEPQNYAEAYKWFALAAKAGDVEAADKCDEIAAQLDDATLAAADLVVKSWKPEPQPDEAIKVKAPPGGWDAATPTPKAKPRTKSARLAGPDAKTTKL